MIFKRILFFIFLYFVMATANAASHQNTNPVVFFVKDMQPFGFIEDGKIGGAGVDAAYYIGDYLKLPVVVKVVPHARMVHNFKYEDKATKQELNMDFTFNIDSQNVSNAIPIVPFFSFEVLMIGKKGLDLTDINQLHDIKIAKIRGARYTKSLSSTAKKIQVVEVSDYKQALQLFAKGRVDAIIGTQFPIIQAGQSLNIDFAILDNLRVIDHTRLWIYASNTSERLYLIPKIKAAVRQMVKDGTVEGYVKKYAGDVAD